MTEATPNKVPTMVIAISVVLMMLTMAVYWPALHYGHVNLDDPSLVFDNEMVTQGLTMQSVTWAFEVSDHDWVPLAYLSWMLDVELWGTDATGFHLTNVMFHVANVIILFLLLKRMTNSLWRSAIVAALFAIHPLQVESVVWIAERRDVLFAFFGLLTIYAYVWYTEKPGWSRYTAIVIAYACCLMSKQMFVTLPFALLLLDFWPLRRFGQVSAAKLTIEKLPLLALAAVEITILMVVVSSYSPVIQEVQELGFGFRFSHTIVSYGMYFRAIFWPFDLAVYYPLPAHWPAIDVALSALVLMAVTVFALWQWRARPYLITGWLWFLGILVPVSGIVAHNFYSHADRYTYVPAIGIFMMFVWGIRSLIEKARSANAVAIALGIVVLLPLAVVSRLQSRHWENSIALWERAASVTEKNWYAHKLLARLAINEDRLADGIAHYETAVRFNPNEWRLRNDLGATLVRARQHEKALEQFTIAHEAQPDNTGILANLAGALLKTNQALRAIPHLQRTVELTPDDPAAHYRLGRVLLENGQADSSIKYLEKALELKPDYAAARSTLQRARQKKAGQR